MKFFEKKNQYDVVCADPIPNVEFLEAYYKNKYYQEGKGSYDISYTEEEIDHKNYEAELIIQALIMQLNRENLGKYKLLELGCGEGFLLNQAFRAGFQVYGVDHSSFGIEKWHPHLKPYHYEQDLYNFIDHPDYNDFFDVCVLKNVLEHVISPEELLQKVKKVLNKKGILILTVPNDYSVLQKALMESKLVSKDEWFCPPDHLYYFNTQNITPFLESFGFNLLDFYCSFPVDLFLLNEHSNYFFDKTKGKQAHFSRIKMDLIIKKSGFSKALELYRAMAKVGIGRNLTVIVQK